MVSSNAGDLRLTAGIGTGKDMPVPLNLDEAHDLRLAIVGDERAFERVYRRHLGDIHRLARWLLSNREVDDAVQEVFFRAWCKLSTYRGDALFRTWLHRLAVNVLLRHRQRLSLHHEELIHAIDIPGRRSGTEDGLDLNSAVATLADGAREVFVLYDVEGYSHDEIANLLGITAHTSRSQLHRARMALRRYLGG